MTTTTQQQETLRPVAARSDVVAAQAEVERLCRERDELRKGLPHRSSDVIGYVADPVDPAIVERLRTIDGQIRHAEATAAETRERARERVVAEAHRLKRPLVKELEKRLKSALETNTQLAALEALEHSATGAPLDIAHWPSLTPSEPTREAFFDTWTRNMIERDLLDE